METFKIAVSLGVALMLLGLAIVQYSRGNYGWMYVDLLLAGFNLAAALINLKLIHP